MFAHPLAAFLALLLLLMTSPAGAADTILSARCIGCDMHGRDLHGQDLHGATYIGTDMQHIDLRDADLRNVKFVGVDISGGDLDDSDLRGSTFTGVDFGNSTLRGARVSGIRLTGVDLEHIQLADVDVPEFLARCIGFAPVVARSHVPTCAEHALPAPTSATCAGATGSTAAAGR
jgi:hypothetical protein